MLLCFFLRAEESKEMGFGGFSPTWQRHEKTFLASFFAPKKRPQNDYILHKFLIYVTFYLVLSKLSCTFARGKREIDFKIPPLFTYF